MIKGTPSPDTIHTILDRLATDSDFRERLVGDPKGTLAPFGLEVDESKLPAKRSLPPKHEIQARRDELHAQVQGNLGLIIFVL